MAREILGQFDFSDREDFSEGLPPIKWFLSADGGVLLKDVSKPSGGNDDPCGAFQGVDE